MQIVFATFRFMSQSNSKIFIQLQGGEAGVRQIEVSEFANWTTSATTMRRDGDVSASLVGFRSAQEFAAYLERR